MGLFKQPNFRLKFEYCPVEKPAHWDRGQVAELARVRLLTRFRGRPAHGQKDPRNPDREAGVRVNSRFAALCLLKQPGNPDQDDCTHERDDNRPDHPAPGPDAD